MDHEAFLKRLLQDKKLRLETLRIQYQIDKAVYEARREALANEMHFIEKHLNYKE